VSQQSSRSSLAALTLGTIGVVCGGVGASPLYALKELHDLRHDNVLQETNLVVTARTHDVPWAPFNERASAVQVARGRSKVTLNFGFRSELDVPAALQLLAPQAIELDPTRTSHFLSRETVVRSVGDGMASWRDQRFAMRRNAASAADLLNLPANRVVELGTKAQT
jgi:KUP system potassium uptake protein